MSDTPRTDAEIIRTVNIYTPQPDGSKKMTFELVPASVARQLERELAWERQAKLNTEDDMVRHMRACRTPSSVAEKISKHALIGGTVFDPGISIQTVLLRAYREYEYQQPLRSRQAAAKAAWETGAPSSAGPAALLQEAMEAIKEFAEGDKVSGRLCLHEHYAKAMQLLEQIYWGYKTDARIPSAIEEKK